MTLFPLIRGKVELTATRVELYKYLKETCEEDLHLLHANVTPWWGKTEWYNYGFEWCLWRLLEALKGVNMVNMLSTNLYQRTL